MQPPVAPQVHAPQHFLSDKLLRRHESPVVLTRNETKAVHQAEFALAQWWSGRFLTVVGRTLADARDHRFTGLRCALHFPSVLELATTIGIPIETPFHDDEQGAA